MIQFIDEYRDRFSIEFICETFNTHRVGGFITSRGYRQSKARGMSARSVRDAALAAHIVEVHEANFGVYGVRKMWHTLRRESVDETGGRQWRVRAVGGWELEAS